MTTQTHYITAREAGHTGIACSHCLEWRLETTSIDEQGNTVRVFNPHCVFCLSEGRGDIRTRLPLGPIEGVDYCRYCGTSENRREWMEQPLDGDMELVKILDDGLCDSDECAESRELNDWRDPEITDEGEGGDTAARGTGDDEMSLRTMIEEQRKSLDLYSSVYGFITETTDAGGEEVKPNAAFLLGNITGRAHAIEEWNAGIESEFCKLWGLHRGMIDAHHEDREDLMGEIAEQQHQVMTMIRGLTGWRAW